MQRRQFIQGAAAAIAVKTQALTGFAAEPETQPTAMRELYEYRIYRLQPGNDGSLVDYYLERGLLPALSRRGIGPVGVFRQSADQAPTAPKHLQPGIHVLIPYASAGQFAEAAATIDADPAVRAAAPDYFEKPTKANPAFDRIDTSLLLALPGQPRLVLPPTSRDKSARIFEIRTYESFSEERNLKKVDMFDHGEMDIQRSLGMAPVFYGQAIAGSNLPHLVYMLTSPDREAHKRKWSAFSHDPRWLAMKADPQYADTATHNTNVFVEPAPCSQI
jgi:hypothetical protein